MVNDKISIIVPVYKVENFITECVKSIQNQTYSNLEIILVDDGSPDKSGEICDILAKEDARIRVVHKENGGLSSARNAGIDICTGKYIAFVDSDDYIAKDMYEKLYNKMTETESDVVVCDFDIVDESSKIIHYDYTPMPEKTLTGMEALRETLKCYRAELVVAWNKLYRCELFSGVRYSEGKLHEDEFIIHNIFKNCKKIVCIQDKLYYYRKSKNSITTSSYSVKRLDGVEALMKRVLFLIEADEITTAYLTLKRAIAVFVNGTYRLDKTKSENRDRIKELQKLYKKVFSQIPMNQVPMKYRMMFYAYRLFPGFCSKLIHTQK